jgi:hypothetical protein
LTRINRAQGRGAFLIFLKPGLRYLGEAAALLQTKGAVWPADLALAWIRVMPPRRQFERKLMI